MDKLKYLKSFGGLVLGAVVTAIATRWTVSEEVDKKLKDTGVTTDEKEGES